MGSYRFFQNKDCEYFPCHKCSNEEKFNCLFCYCPLYALGEKCNGNYTYTVTGVKDCTNCTIPHRRESYDYIVGRFQELDAVAKKMNLQDQGKNKDK